MKRGLKYLDLCDAHKHFIIEWPIVCPYNDLECVISGDSRSWVKGCDVMEGWGQASSCLWGATL